MERQVQDTVTDTSEALRSGVRNLSGPLPSYTSNDGHRADGTLPIRREDCDKLSDGDLVRLIAWQSREALEGLYDRYSGAVYSLAVYMLQDAGAAEEVTQDTFFKVWRKGSSYNPERGKVTSWLFSIAHHRVIDEVRRRRRRDRNQVFQDVDLIDRPADDSSDPTRYAMVQMRRSRIKDALSALRPEQREVVVLAYYGGLTHSEMAKRLELPLGTVKTRMRLALKKLKEVLEPRVRELMDYGL